MSEEKTPSFIIIGAAKSGTSSVFQHLGQHDEVFCSRKEPRFFDQNFNKGWEWYLEHFSDALDGRVICEASVSYSMFRDAPVVPARIHEYLPDVKLIYITRHPIERIGSNWGMMVTESAVTGSQIADLTFEQALYDPRWFPLLTGRSMYWSQINAFREYFPDSQIKCMFFEEFVADAQSFMDDLFSFIGVSAKKIDQSTSYRPQNKLTRPDAPKPAWTDELLGHVWDELRPDIEAYLNYAGRPLDYWSSSMKGIKTLRESTERAKLGGLVAYQDEELRELNKQLEDAKEKIAIYEESRVFQLSKKTLRNYPRLYTWCSKSYHAAFEIIRRMRD